MSNAPAKIPGYPAPDMDPDSVWLDGLDHTVRAGIFMYIYVYIYI
jgi:hypothetical protein